MLEDDKNAIDLLAPLIPAMPAITRLVMLRQLTIPSLSAAFVSINDDLETTVAHVYGSTFRGLKSLASIGVNAEESMEILNRGRDHHAYLAIPHIDFAVSMSILVTSVTECLKIVTGRDVSTRELLTPHSNT